MGICSSHNVLNSTIRKNTPRVARGNQTAHSTQPACRSTAQAAQANSCPHTPATAQLLKFKPFKTLGHPGGLDATVGHIGLTAGLTAGEAFPLGPHHPLLRCCGGACCCTVTAFMLSVSSQRQPGSCPVLRTTDSKTYNKTVREVTCKFDLS
jgi:hypothetical protein